MEKQQLLSVWSAQGEAYDFRKRAETIVHAELRVVLL